MSNHSRNEAHKLFTEQIVKEIKAALRQLDKNLIVTQTNHDSFQVTFNCKTVSVTCRCFDNIMVIARFRNEHSRLSLVDYNNPKAFEILVEAIYNYVLEAQNLVY